MLSRRNSIQDRQKVEVPVTKIRRTCSISDADIVDSTPTYVLPIDETPYPIKRITPQTLVKVMSGEFSQHFDRLVIVDCRFRYEYEAGHIHNAININTKGALRGRFFEATTQRTCVVFHCEFSSQRAPRACAYMRSHDRVVNAVGFPYLHFPDIYVVEGGYKNFFQQYPEYCTPQAYLEMRDPRFAEECAINETLNEREWSEGKSSRSKSARQRDPMDDDDDQL